MERVAISSSLRHKELIREAIARLDRVGVTAVFPNLDSGVDKEDVTLAYMRIIERDHFLAIRQSQGLYVICPDGEVGTLVSVEIGYAQALDRPIIFSNDPRDLGLRALVTNLLILQEIEKLVSF